MSHLRRTTLLVAVLAWGLCGPGAGTAWAFDPIGWVTNLVRGGDDAADPSARVQYTVAFQVPSNSEVEVAARERSELARQSDAGVPDLAVLVARARSDRDHLRAVLQELGYFASDVRLSIDGIDLDLVDVDRTIDAAQPVQVLIGIDPGAAFHFGLISFTANRDTWERPAFAAEDFGLTPGAVARSPAIAKAISAYVEAWHAAGYPLAHIVQQRVVADHATEQINVEIVVDPGDEAVIGWVSVSGANDLDPDFLGRYSALEFGRRYQPDDLERAAERLRKLEAVDSVRIVHGPELDAGGGIPIVIEVVEQKPRFVGAMAAISSVDGGEMHAYWGHRNVFGHAERFRVDAGLSQVGAGGLPALQYFAKAALTKPGVFDINTDFFVEFGAARERPDTYESETLKFQTGFDHQFSLERSGRIALRADLSREEDAFGRETYAVVALPVQIAEDTRDNRLDPTSGWRGTIGLEPAYEFMQSHAFLVGHGEVSQYLALDPDGRLVIAGRAASASVFAGDIRDVPASRRVFAGGGGSVRGFPFRSLGPRVDDEVVGGLSLLETSLELRWRVTPSIGVVPFVDLATVSSEVWPEFETFHAGAGVGLRYYTALGPVRLDFATPLTGGDEFSDVAFYVGLGQAF